MDPLGGRQELEAFPVGRYMLEIRQGLAAADLKEQLSDPGEVDLGSGAGAGA